MSHLTRATGRLSSRLAPLQLYHSGMVGAEKGLAHKAKESRTFLWSLRTGPHLVSWHALPVSSSRLFALWASIV